MPDFRETYEIPDGLFRTTIPACDESVVRELLVNALVHRPYSQGGPIFLNLHPDRLTVANAGRLPFGVTPRNILHTSRWRNADLARVFHDIQLMEREGSGFDLMYDRLLATGRAAPTVEETVDAVHVTIQRRVLHSSVVRLVSEVGQRHMLTQRERITLGILGQSEAMTGVELVRALELQEQGALRDWLGRLVAMGVVGTSGRTNATRYFVEPVWLQATGIEIPTTLTRIQPHRLRALILEDLERYPESGRSEIQQRIGTEISPRTISRALKELVEQGEVESTGTKRWTRYRLATSNCTKPP